MKKNKGMKKVLLKDIIIPAGTVFTDAPIKTERAEGAFGQATIGLSKDTCGTIEYELPDNDCEQLKEWFADLKE